MNRNNTIIGLIVVAVICIVLALLWAGINRFFSRASATQDLSELSGAAGGGGEEVSTPLPTFTPFAPTPVPTQVPSIPQPYTARVSASDAQLGNLAGKLIFPNGRMYSVFKGYLNENGELVTFASGFSIYEGVFSGHLIQSAYGMPLEIKEGYHLTWIPQAGDSMFFRLESPTSILGYDGAIQLPDKGEYIFVTCILDEKTSTPQNPVFVGNVVFRMVRIK